MPDAIRTRQARKQIILRTKGGFRTGNPLLCPDTLERSPGEQKDLLSEGVECYLAPCLRWLN